MGWGWLSMVLALPIRRRSRDDVAHVWAGTKQGQGGDEAEAGDGVVCVQLVVVEWVGGADVAPK